MATAPHSPAALEQLSIVGLTRLEVDVMRRALELYAGLAHGRLELIAELAGPDNDGLIRRADGERASDYDVGVARELLGGVRSVLTGRRPDDQRPFTDNLAPRARAALKLAAVLQNGEPQLPNSDGEQAFPETTAAVKPP